MLRRLLMTMPIINDNNVMNALEPFDVSRASFCTLSNRDRTAKIGVEKRSESVHAEYESGGRWSARRSQAVVALAKVRKRPGGSPE